jgi:dethiobiotin synthetase
MKNSAYFITGTDTGVGKTYVTTRLLKQFQENHASAIALKPISTGAIVTAEGLQNDDARILQHASSIKLPLTDINPFVFAPPIAPHLAAEKANTPLSAASIQQRIHATMTRYPCEHYLIEGAGGLLVPLNETETIADLIKLLNIPIILVIAIRLGCINHALLTQLAIKTYQLPCRGWIANCLDPSCDEQEAIIEYLKKSLSAPYLHTILFNQP